jgi:phospholipid/cholesterol/gamma-HCH transport system substrate-binding protein
VKHENINYVMVGSLVIAMFAILFIVLIRVTGQNVDTQSYYVVYGDISGVAEGTSVTFGGFAIGQVTAIQPVRLQGKTLFKLNLAIDEQWKLPVDSVARIASPGILSDKTIDIVEGSSKDMLQAGAEIRSQESADLFAAVDEVAFEIKDLSENSIRPMLEKFSQSIDNVSKRIDNIGGELDKGVPDLLVSANRFMTELNNNVDRLSAVLNDSNQKNITSAISNIDSLSQNLVGISQRLDGTITQFDKLIVSYGSVVDNNDEDIRKAVLDLRKSLNAVSENIDSIVYNLDTTSRNVSEFSRQIRNNPGVLLGGSPPKDAGEAR